jgi:alpha-D-xyloside xylohydrolase
LSEWWEGVGGLVDFTDPKAIDWWHGQLRRTKAYGARAFKVDDGEGNFVPDAVFADGTPARLMKNRYGTLYDSVMQAYIDRDLGGDGVLITRSGSTGANRYPFQWAGDNEGSFSFADGLPSVVIAGQNAAMSGIALWGTDIAGYAGRPSKDVFIRWTQFAAFTPFMQVHMTSNLGPWDFDDQTLEIFRRFTVLRTRLFPYLYDAAHEAARSGMPVIRPMPFAFEGDDEARRHMYQYMYGPDLLVAPIVQPGMHRAVYLPAGSWIDFWTGETLAGPRTIEVEAPLERMPLFVRAGAVLPMLPADVQTLVPRTARMAADVVAIDGRRVLQVWPGASGAVRTYDGIDATVERSGADVTLRWSSPTARPLSIELPYTRATLAAGMNAQASVEASARTTSIRIPRPARNGTLRWTEAKW